MPNSVYRFHFLNELLPDSDEDKAAFAKENTAKLTGGAEGEVIFYMQPHNHEPTCRLTISVPERLTRVHGTLRAAGAVPAFQEPEAPYWEDNTLVLPGSFQVLRLGSGWIRARWKTTPGGCRSLQRKRRRRRGTCRRRPGTS